MHPEEGLAIYQMRGPFGPYLQLGEVTEETPKPKRCSIPNCFDPGSIDLETAISLLALPRRIGKHPLTDKVVNAGIGRFGPYVTHDKVFGSFDKKAHTYDFNGETFNVLNITMDAAVELLRNTKKRAAPTPLRELGNHPEDGNPIQIFEGKFGPYIKHTTTNATIPKDTDIATVTIEEAVRLIADKISKGGGKPGKKGGFTKKVAKKAAAKKTDAKKPAKKKKKSATPEE
jgi:DNA topoisomerase-1